MKCRKNVKNLSPTEKENFARAVNLLKNEPSVVNPGGQSRYDDFAKAHLDTMTAGADWTHGDSAFFPWHRELIYQFELELDRMVPGVTVPFWEWTREQSELIPVSRSNTILLGLTGTMGKATKCSVKPVHLRPTHMNLTPKIGISSSKTVI